MADEDIEIGLKLKNELSDQIKKAENDVKKSADNMAKSMSSAKNNVDILNKSVSLLGNAAKGLAGLFALQKIAGFLNDARDASKEDALAYSQLTAAIGGVNVGLDIQSRNLSDLYNVQVGDIVNVQKQISEHTKDASIIKELTPAVINMAKATGMSTEAAAQQLSTVIKSGRGIKEYGISVKGLNTEQERADALVRQVNERFSDQAMAEVNNKDALDKLIVSFGEFQGNIGNFADLPAVKFFLDFLNKGVKGLNDMATASGNMKTTEDLNNRSKLLQDQIKLQKDIAQLKERQAEYDKNKNNQYLIAQDYTQDIITKEKELLSVKKELGITTKIINKLNEIDPEEEKKKAEAAQKALQQDKKLSEQFLANVKKRSEDSAKEHWDNLQLEKKQTEDAYNTQLTSVSNYISSKLTLIDQSNNAELIKTKEYLTQVESLYSGNFEAIAQLRSKSNDIDIQITKNNNDKAKKDSEDYKKYQDAKYELSVFSANSIFAMEDNISSIKQNNLDYRYAKERKLIETSRMSEEQKQSALAKLEKRREAEQIKLMKSKQKWDIAQVISSTAVSIIDTWKGYSGLGIFGTGLAIAQTAMLGALGGTQIAKIASQKFRDGGVVQGSGGIDSQLVQATPGEVFLNGSQQANLLMAIGNGKLNNNSESSNITTGSIIVNGNASSETVKQIRQSQIEQIKQLKDIQRKSKRLYV